MDNAYAVIMAGGKGECLWPLSTPERPKQFLRLLGDRSMLQETADRIAPLVPAERILVVTSVEHVHLVREQLPDLPESNILAEPTDRGTAACIGLAALLIQSRTPESVMVTLPSDHVIRDQEAFRDVLKEAIRLARAGTHLLTFGVSPTRPETGYIHAVKRSSGEDAACSTSAVRIEHYIEKPDRDTAKRFLDDGTYYWNSGMFAWNVETILQEIQVYLPDLYRSLTALTPYMNKDTFDTALAKVYAQIDSQSIDHGIIEKSSRILLIPMPNIGWTDVGGWEALRQAIERREKPWGHEHLWALNQHYAGKLLHIRSGECLSLQYHETKDETIYVLEGKLRLRIGPSASQLVDRLMSAGESQAIAPGIVHQMESLEDCVIAEVSTPQLDDVVRLHDRYGREGTASETT